MIKRIEMMTAFSIVPMVAYVSISMKLWKKALLFRKYVASNMINGTKMYKNMSGEKLSSFSAYSRSRSHRMIPVIIPKSRMRPDSGKYCFIFVF